MKFKKTTKIMLFLLALAVAWLVSLGAAPLSAQALVFNKVEFEPTPFHEAIYEMMEACSGRQGSFEDVRWFVAKMILVGNPVLGRNWIGMWMKTETGAEITLERDHAFDGYVVSHEVFHDLYQGNAPMDMATRCTLTWKRLREPVKTEEH